MFHKGVLKSNMFILSRFFCWKFVIFYFQQECEIMLEGPQTQCILIFLLIQNWNFDSRENFRFPPISPPTLLKHLQTSYGWCEMLGRKGCASNEQRGRVVKNGIQRIQAAKIMYANFKRRKIHSKRFFNSTNI